MAQGFANVQPSIAGSGPTDIFVNGVKQATTSGSSVDFTVPSGIKWFSLSLKDVSNSGTGSQNMMIQLGDAGGIETTGYTGTAARSTASTAAALYDTDGFSLSEDAFQGTANDLVGIVHFVLHDAATNTWVAQGQIGRADSAGMAHTAGSKALSGELTTVRLINDGSHTFDGGSVNIQYDNPDPTVVANVQPGKVLQVVNAQDGEVATGTTTMPDDDTIPQNTEGTEFMTASITPTNSANKLKIEVVVNASGSGGDTLTAALFQGNTASAIATAADRNTGSVLQNLTLTHWMTAGTASSTTFKVRVGDNAAGTVTFNGIASARVHAGVMASSITITEIAA